MIAPVWPSKKKQKTKKKKTVTKQQNDSKQFKAVFVSIHVDVILFVATMNYDLYMFRICQDLFRTPTLQVQSPDQIYYVTSRTLT